VAWRYRNHSKSKSAAPVRARRKCGTLATENRKLDFRSSLAILDPLIAAPSQRRLFPAADKHLGPAPPIPVPV
jgi:hypothetical protein